LYFGENCFGFVIILDPTLSQKHLIDNKKINHLCTINQASKQASNMSATINAKNDTKCGRCSQCLDETTHDRRPIPDDALVGQPVSEEKEKATSPRKPRKTVSFAYALAMDTETGRVLRRNDDASIRINNNVLAAMQAKQFGCQNQHRHGSSRRLIKLGWTKLHRTFQTSNRTVQAAVSA
jgi:hypothetical protein